MEPETVEEEPQEIVMEPTTTTTSEKTRKRTMSPEALERLKVAREKANAKRKELASARAAQKNDLIQKALKEQEESKQKRLEKAAEQEAKKILANKSQYSGEPTPPKEEPKPPKIKRQSIVIEHSDSSSEDDILDARVYRVRRSREDKENIAPAPVAPDPYAGSFAQLFRGSTTIM